MTKKNLTFKYVLSQACYWLAYCGMFSFAATFMLGKGYSAAYIGVILFLGNFLSFLFQPFLADYVDKATKNVLPAIMAGMALLSGLCFLLIALFDLPKLVFSVVYVIAICVMDMQIPLLNSISVYYSIRMWNINYEAGRAAGAIGFAIASPIIGFVMQHYSIDWMPIISIVTTIIYAFVCISYPKTPAGDVKIKVSATESSSLIQFIKKYRWYCASIVGILFCSLVHIMTENYLIEIVRPLGGDSSTVGLALLFATVIEAPAMIVFGRLHKKFGSYKIMCLGGFFYVVKMLLFVLASMSFHVVLIELMQAVSYVFISPVQMYYARECIDNKDMVKGQSTITAAYSLGLAVGNLFGGLFITGFGLRFMLKSSVFFALIGFFIILFAVPKAIAQNQRKD